MLGACLTRTSRLDERSTVAVLGDMLRTQLLARGGGGEDGALADAVAGYLRSITIPDIFCAGAAGVDDLRIEAKEMMAYHRSVSGRREVERARLHHSRDGYLEGCAAATPPPNFPVPAAPAPRSLGMSPPRAFLSPPTGPLASHT